MAVAEFNIKYHGFFDLEEIYKGLNKKLKEMNFSIKEDKYKYKGDSFGFSWIARRQPHHYVSEAITVDFKAYDLKDVEIIKNNTKMLLKSGKIVVKISADMSLGSSDYLGNNLLEKNSLTKKLKELFEKKVFKSESKKYKKDTQKAAEDLANFTKKILNMKVYIE